MRLVLQYLNISDDVLVDVEPCEFVVSAEIEEKEGSFTVTYGQKLVVVASVETVEEALASF